MAKQIVLHNTPEFYVEYTKNWLKKNPNANQAEKMIIQDIATLVEIAAAHLEPQPAELADKPKNES